MELKPFLLDMWLDAHEHGNRIQSGCKHRPVMDFE
jgi:hypothetical protein